MRSMADASGWPPRASARSASRLGNSRTHLRLVSPGPPPAAMRPGLHGYRFAAPVRSSPSSAPVVEYLELIVRELRARVKNAAGLSLTPRRQYRLSAQMTGLPECLLMIR
jgi:hypothetical protein